MLPVSAIVLMMVEGGPTIRLLVFAFTFVLVLNSALFAFCALLFAIEGSPRPHGVGVGVRGVRTGRT